MHATSFRIYSGLKKPRLTKQRPASGILRFLGRALLHAVPIDGLPPVVQVLALSSQAKVVNEGVLPGANAQHGRNTGASGRDLRGFLAKLAVRAERAQGVGGLVLIVGRGRRIVSIDALLAVASFRERSSSGVGSEDAPGALGAGGLRALGVFAPDKPDEARSEHGGGGIEEGGAQGVDGAESLDERLLEEVVARQLQRLGAETLVEEVVVESHAGVVEDGGVLGVTRVFQQQGLDVCVLVGLAGEELIELLQHNFLVGCPSQLVADVAEEAGHAVLLELLLVDQFGRGTHIAAEGAGEGAVLCLLGDCFAVYARRCSGL